MLICHCRLSLLELVIFCLITRTTHLTVVFFSWATLWVVIVLIFSVLLVTAIYGSKRINAEALEAQLPVAPHNCNVNGLASVNLTNFSPLLKALVQFRSKTKLPDLAILVYHDFWAILSSRYLLVWKEALSLGRIRDPWIIKHELKIVWVQWLERVGVLAFLHTISLTSDLGKLDSLQFFVSRNLFGLANL